MTIRKLGDGIFVDESLNIDEKNPDAIIFDCDGVLIDITNSYDLTIKNTTAILLKKIAAIEKSDPVTIEMIEGFKKTGGFNDEVDLTYALILSYIAAKKLNKPASKFVFDVIENSNKTGIGSVEKYLESLVDLSDVRKRLDYPGSRSTNILCSFFDQLFYGSELLYKLYKKKSQFDGKGLIENDKVLLKKELVDTLRKKFSKKISIVTGRGIESIRYSLKELLNEFDLKNSVFLEDEPRELAKPNPASLLRAISGIGSRCTIFVGDSTEDLIMAKEAEQMGTMTIFCGIYGTSKHPEEKLRMFEEKKADMILESIDLIPKALNLEQQ